MNHEFSNRTSSVGSILFGVVFGLFGIGVMIFLSVLYGVGIFIFGLLLFFLIRYFASDVSIRCDDESFTVKVVNKRKGSKLNHYKWEDVLSTLYYERESGGEDSSSTSYFMVKVPEGVAFDFRETKGFHELIQIFNEKTPHLPYVWGKIGDLKKFKKSEDKKI